MPNPTKYIPGYSFLGGVEGDPALYGTKLDNEFAEIAISLGATIDGLTDLRRSDGKLKNDIVAFEALAPAVRAAIATGGGAGGSGALLVGDIDGLPEALDAKADRTAVLALDDAVDDLTSSTASALAGKADLVDGKVPTDQLPVKTVMSLSPFDYGGVGDGVADDTAALNQVFAIARAAANASQGSANGWRVQVPMSIDLSGGRWRITGNGINATGIAAWNLEIRGGLLVGECTGKAILDLVGTRGFSLNGVAFYGDKTNRPSCAYQLARPTPGGFCDNCSFYEVSTTGWFSRTAIHCYAHETALHSHCTYFNYDYTARVAIFEGSDATPFTSAFTTVMSGGTSFINNKVDNCDFRYLPIGDNYAPITGLTIGANPTITMSGGHSFQNGEKVCFAGVGGQDAIQRVRATVTNRTATTFVAQGITTTGTYTGGGGVIRSQTKPSVYLGRAQDFNFDSSYIVSYGQPHIQLGFPDTGFKRMDDIRLDLLYEGSGQDHNIAVDTSGQAVAIQGFEMTAYSSVANVAVIGITSGQFSVYDAKLASYSQLGPALMVAPPALFAGYGCRIMVPINAYADPTGYAGFSGDVLAVSTGFVTEYGKAGASGDWTPILTTTGGALGSYTASGSFQISGALLHVTMSIQIGSVGSGSGDLQCTNLPFARVKESSNWAGRIVSGGGANGYMIQAFGGINNPKLLTIARFDGLSAAGSGLDMRLSGTYQII